MAAVIGIMFALILFGIPVAWAWFLVKACDLH